MRVEVRSIGDSDQSRWDEFVSSHPDSSVYHQYGWRKFYSRFFRKDTCYFAAFVGDSISGVVPLVRQKSLVFGDYFVSVPFFNYGGILAKDDESENALVKALTEFIQTHSASHIELRGTKQIARLPAKKNKVAMLLDLPTTYQSLSSSFGAKLRSQIRRPMREDPEVKVGGLDLLDAFYAVFSRNMRDLGTPVYSKSMFAEILTSFSSQAEIVCVEIGGQPTAAAFLLHGDAVSEVPWASSDRRFNRIGVNMLLYSELLRRSIEVGSNVFDFGRSSIDSGTYRFKKQWGATPRQLYWAYVMKDKGELPELNPENSKYAAAIGLWRRLPLPVANLIGPRLARNLP